MKSKQLQIRVTPAELNLIKHYAHNADMSVSEWVLSEILSAEQEKFRAIVAAIPTDRSYAFAELNEFLESLSPQRFAKAVARPPQDSLSPYEANYLAALVQYAAERKESRSPEWTREIAPLLEPHFASALKSLRLHLLRASPPAFKSRNIFIDSSLGDRV